MAMKGIYYSLDALFALTLILTAFFALYDFDISQITDVETILYKEIAAVAEDGLQLPANEKFSSAFDQAQQQFFITTTALEEEDKNKTVLETITILWAAGNLSAASNITEQYFSSIIPDKYNYSLKISDQSVDLIFNTSNQSGNLITASTRIISGLKKNIPKEGNVAKASLSKVTSEQKSTAYFGGYVGDGNITLNMSLTDFPNVTEIYLEADVSGPFDFYINDNYSGSYQPDNSSQNLSATKITVCNATLNPSYCGFITSDNLIDFNFTGKNASFGGGFLQISYVSEDVTFSSEGAYRTKVETFPGIKGIINLFSSFYVPGQLQNISGSLHFDSNNRTIFLQIANATVYEATHEGETIVQLNNSNILLNLSSAGLNLSDLSERTIPIRLGVKGLDFVKSKAIADSVSVIDVSGSMAGTPLQEAKNASKRFVDILLNASGNRAGLVSYASNIGTTHELSTDNTSLKAAIDGLDAIGATCIGCGILEGIIVLSQPKYVSLLPRNSNWSYNFSYPFSDPPNQGGTNWTTPSYNDSSWATNTAILGFGSNVNTTISDNGGNYFFRAPFDYDSSLYSDVNIYLRSDDRAEIYLNGVLIDNDTQEHNGTYWNRIVGNSVMPIFEDYFESGSFTSVIATAFEEDFESSLGSNWTITSGSLTNEIDISDECGTTSGDNALVIGWGGAEIETKELDLSGLQNMKVEYRLKQGGDDGPNGNCENPESTDDLTIRYWANDSTWKNLRLHDGGSSDPAEGAWGTYSLDLPQDALHSAFKIRFSYPVGSGQGWDYWAVDDFSIVEAMTSWDVTSGTLGNEFTINSECTSISDDNAMIIRWNAGTIESQSINVSDLSNGRISYYLRRGADDGPNNRCENPEAGEDVIVEYWANDSTWNNLATHEGGTSDPQGSSWNEYSYDLPSDSNKAFKIRFRYAGGTGPDWDYWAVDNVIVGELLTLNQSLLTKGSNFLAVKLINNDSISAEFDIEVNASERRDNSMIVMSDGESNVLTSMSGVTDRDGDSDVDSKDHSIEAACRAKSNYNITVYAVGFGPSVDTQTLNLTAECGGGEYFFADTGELEEIFANITDKIVNASFIGQTIESEEAASQGKLFPDSFLSFNYSSSLKRTFGTFVLDQTSSRFGGNITSPKNGTFELPSGLTPIEALATSYSSNFWTDRLLIQDETGNFTPIYELWNYDSDYEQLGDPFLLYIPPDKVINGTNTVQLDTALSQNNTKGASPDNLIFYKLEVPGSVPFGEVFENSKGGTKTLETIFGNITVSIGDSQDSWNPSQDALDDALERLLQKLDVDNDSIIDVSLESDSIDVSTIETGKVPWLFGPVKIVLEVWK